MKKIFNILDHTIGFINRWIAAIGISAGVALAFANVVARYGFNYSITWASELTVYFFLWSMFFGVAYCFKLGEHIAIGLLVEHVSKNVAKGLILFTYLVTFIFLVAVSYYGYEYLQLVIELDEVSVDLAIPMWIPYLVIPVSFAFSAYRIVEHIVALIKLPAEEIEFRSEASDLMKEMNKEYMKHKGAIMLILGALILTNIYWIKLGWGAFVGGVFVLGGLVKMLHGCKCKGKK